MDFIFYSIFKLFSAARLFFFFVCYFSTFSFSEHVYLLGLQRTNAQPNILVYLHKFDIIKPDVAKKKPRKKL